jgi:L-cysteine:1D-myo-inositol 2-amino-2-deoxy-alpha-D-glucopyranoside ligase
MSTKYLGKTIDVHSGGADLRFPHHECEIAQIEPSRISRLSVLDSSAMVYHDGAKMSKSLGNLIMVRDLLKVYSSDALRIYLGMHHYRDIWSYSESELKAAEVISNRINLALTMHGDSGQAIDPSWAVTAFEAALEND